MADFIASIIRDGVKLTNDFIQDLQASIIHTAWTGYTNASGDSSYAEPVQLKCIVSTQQSDIFTASGQIVSVMATLTFIGDVLPNGAPGRREPFDPRDIIILPDGSTGPIIDTPSGVNDPLTGRGFTHKVLLGRKARQGTV